MFRRELPKLTLPEQPTATLTAILKRFVSKGKGSAGPGNRLNLNKKRSLIKVNKSLSTISLNAHVSLRSEEEKAETDDDHASYYDDDYGDSDDNGDSEQ